MSGNLLDFARVVTQIGVRMPMAEAAALEQACQIVEDEAKRVIGTYDYGWTELADATKEDRKAKGYPENEPLLRSGDLRDSISHEVVKSEHAGYVGSPLKIALYQEMGTATIPARSFLGGAAMHKEHEIHALTGRIVKELIVGTLMGRSLNLKP